MTSPQKRKGDVAELEIARILHDLTGWPVRRKLGAGRTDDEGDLEGSGLSELFSRTFLPKRRRGERVTVQERAALAVVRHVPRASGLPRRRSCR